MPSVNKITEEILDMENTFKNSNNHFYKYKSKPSKELFPEYYEYNEVIKKILGVVSCEAEKYYGNNYKTNYEEIYYLVKQVDDKFEYDNPAILAFMEKVNVEIEFLLKGNGDTVKCCGLEITYPPALHYAATSSTNSPSTNFLFSSTFSISL